MTASVLLIIIGTAVIVWAFRLQVGTLLRPLAGFFPLLVGVAVIVLSLILFVQGWLGRGEAPKAFGRWQKPVVMLVALGIYAFLLEPLGYIPSTIFIAAVTLRILGVVSWGLIAVSSVVLSVVVYVLFTQFLGVELPAGVLSFLG